MPSGIDFLPTADANRIVWFGNFAAKFAQYAAPLGFTSADVAAINNDYATFVYVVNAAAQYKDEYAERVATVKFVKGCFDGIQLEMATGSSPGFVVAGSVLQSPFAHNAAPSATGTPEMRRYRARFVKGNVAVGEYSDIVSVLVG